MTLLHEVSAAHTLILTVALNAQNLWKATNQMSEMYKPHKLCLQLCIMQTSVGRLNQGND